MMTVEATVTLGDRMKAYENAHRAVLPARTHALIRVDGKAFHTYTRGLNQPYDEALMSAMDATATALCKEASGVVCAFVQSDEISVLLADYKNEGTQAWLGGVTAKIISLSAAIATAAFNATHVHPLGRGPALFDARVFTVPSSVEVVNYFRWRQLDAYRNAISMTADQALGKKTTVGMSLGERVRQLEQSGVDLDTLPSGFLHGRLVTPDVHVMNVVYVDKRTGEERVARDVPRTVWTVHPAPALRDPGFLIDRFPYLSTVG